MAFWQRKSGNRIFVYYWDKAAMKQRTLPRDETRSLDMLTTEEIDAWVHNWELKHIPVSLELDHDPLSDPLWIAAVDAFCNFLDLDFGRHPSTIQIHRRNLLVFALAFFRHELELENLADIREHSRLMSPWLRKRFNLPETKIKAIHHSLRMFWNWLSEEGVATGQLLLRSRRLGPRQTPLQQLPTPDDILSWIGERSDLRLLLLLGYFFSLRPQETFALQVNDFVAGKLAQTQEPCRVMAAAGLYDRLLVKIYRQKSRGLNHMPDPKANSKGLVACFNEDAAKEIVKDLNQRERDQPLFPFGADWYFKSWRRYGYPNLTLKDCRRASLYWLGHYTNLDIVGLRNHARHKSIETTALYTRRPLDLSVTSDSLNLEG